MANPENLIPIGSRDPREIRELAMKGGKTRSPKRKYAAKLRELKKKGFKDELTQWFVERIEDPECNIIQIQKWLDQAIQSALEVGDRGDIIRAVNASAMIHKLHHGDASAKSVTVNIQNNIIMTEEERWKKIEELGE